MGGYMTSLKNKSKKPLTSNITTSRDLAFFILDDVLPISLQTKYVVFLLTELPILAPLDR